MTPDSWTEAWDRICKEAGPMSEPARRRLLTVTERRKPAQAKKAA